MEKLPTYSFLEICNKQLIRFDYSVHDILALVILRKRTDHLHAFRWFLDNKKKCPVFSKVPQATLRWFCQTPLDKSYQQINWSSKMNITNSTSRRRTSLKVHQKPSKSLCNLYRIKPVLQIFGIHILFIMYLLELIWCNC